ncbi:MAG: DNA mismatch repair protein MutS [Gammaproteobacteria bacterium HGW-Gammaproteobacteria-10]|uniref:DNA mismatch repair protein MutS n=1 Tax=Methylotuvimicrobium buryatense TaxID=95641 RepID=A0A4P9UPA8_METBY|nr:Smr/MutS family protein [Methylotuvimicrobium buryatense]PKM35909.1 MAG: DNA mismatch repair protein MutS [Gammaproteobacteria bacterium HGW-Gammaproteobacteria-10]QCW83097.1 DNA mismatch repair protein MutS [Methylotuvimicrobium buryatense]
MRKKSLTQEDRDLFRHTVGKVISVATDKLHLKTSPKPKPIPAKRSVEHTQALDESISVTEQLSLEDSMGFLSPGLQKNVLRKMRKGHYGLDAEIDLHGLSSHEAKKQLLRFLHSCVEEGYRCVCIVHGKGYRSPDNLPILKNSLNVWLRQHRDVQAFCSAPQREGGTGAVFVLLRLTDKYDEQNDAER